MTTKEQSSINLKAWRLKNPEKVRAYREQRKDKNGKAYWYMKWNKLKKKCLIKGFDFDLTV